MRLKGVRRVNPDTIKLIAVLQRTRMKRMKDFILQLMPISAIDKRLCQRVKSLKYDKNDQRKFEA